MPSKCITVTVSVEIDAFFARRGKAQIAGILAIAAFVFAPLRGTEITFIKNQGAYF